MFEEGLLQAFSSLRNFSVRVDPLPSLQASRFWAAGSSGEEEEEESGSGSEAESSDDSDSSSSSSGPANKKDLSR